LAGRGGGAKKKGSKKNRKGVRRRRKGPGKKSPIQTGIAWQTGKLSKMRARRGAPGGGKRTEKKRDWEDGLALNKKTVGEGLYRQYFKQNKRNKPLAN